MIMRTEVADMKHLLTLRDLQPEEFTEIFELSADLKRQLKKGIKPLLLKGKILGMIFSKSSTRTRVSFETGMYQLGGHAIFLSSSELQLGRGESIADTTRVLSRYLDGIMIRTYRQKDVEDLARYGAIPVINGLTDLYHPCQVLADLFTLKEIKGELKGLKLAYVGDGNNIVHSLLYGCSKTGVNLSIASPEGYDCSQEILAEAMNIAAANGTSIKVARDPAEAVKDADAVYTDTWISMGMEKDKEKRIKDFEGYTVNKQLFALAKPDAVFLHCLPAYRGYEVTDNIIDGPNSVVFDEAENRLHVQKAIMVMLMGENNNGE
jgi:ornithine carbamoyltransferase